MYLPESGVVLVVYVRRVVMVSTMGCPLSVSVLSCLVKNSSIKPPGFDETVLRS